MIRSSRTLLVTLALLSIPVGASFAQGGGGYIPSGGASIHPTVQIVSAPAPKTRSYYIELLTRLALRMTRPAKMVAR